MGIRPSNMTAQARKVIRGISTISTKSNALTDYLLSLTTGQKARILRVNVCPTTTFQTNAVSIQIGDHTTANKFGAKTSALSATAAAGTVVETKHSDFTWDPTYAPGGYITGPTQLSITFPASAGTGAFVFHAEIELIGDK